MVKAVKVPGPIISCDWLASVHSGVTVLDASLHFPVAGMGTASEVALTIPGARIFDLDRRICDRTTPLPHMMPPADVFVNEVRALGIDRGRAVVVFDRKGVYSSPRARWMFKAMGHDNVAVLDGGLPAWIDRGYPVAAPSVQAAPLGDFIARPRVGLFCDVTSVQSALATGSSRVIDARPTDRFFGRVAEPRPGLRRGHMPGALNLPFTDVLDGTRLRHADEVRTIFAAVVPTAHTPLVFSCGSGVTACIVALAAEIAGYLDLSIYDGSWSEWGLPSALPVVMA